MTEQPRDWDRELADVDRAITKQGSGPPAGALPSGTAPGPGPGPRGPVAPRGGPVRRRSVALTWFWVVLAVALGVALAVWPYQRACGLQLIFFLGAAGVTALIALLGALASWSHHRGIAHVLSLLVILWAGFATLREVLPRVGYAKTGLAWMCEAAPAAPAPGGVRPGTAAPGSPGQ
jgi:hypothetical protein